MPTMNFLQIRWLNAKVSAILLGICFSVLPAHARTINAASTSQTDVSAAISSAATGDTVNIPAGTSTWNSAVFINKGIYIFGAGTGSTRLINGTSAPQGLETPVFQIQLAAVAPVRISGIYFQNQGDSMNSDGIDIYPTTFLATQVVVDNCAFEGFSFAMKNLGDFGVCYSCSFLNNKIACRNSGYLTVGDLAGFSLPPWPWNSANYFVWEDCTFTLTNWGSSDVYMMDTEYPMNYMVRHCTFNINRTGDIAADGFDMHGNEGTALNSLGLVIDDNTFNYTGDNQANPSRLADIRGGVGSLVYNNTATGVNLMASVRADSGSVPPTNTYLWNNTGAGGSSLGISTDNNVTQGVNFFLSQPANYTPLQYPHPLRSSALLGGTGGGGSPPTIASPSGLRVVAGGS